MMRKERNSTVEILRIVSMFLIVWFHICGRGLGLFNEEIPNGGGNSLPLIIIHALGMIGVPVFIFISGYYGVKFRWDRLKDILSQCVLYTLVFYLISCIFLPLFQIRILLLQVFGLSGMWFVYCYVILYILSDGINAVLEKFDFKSFTIIVFIIIYISIGKWIGKENGCNLFTMLEYYIIARYAKRFADRYKKYIKWTIVPSIIFFVIPICYGYCSGHYSLIRPYIFCYYNPMLILIAMSLVIAADDYKTRNRMINYVANSVLAVYMLHENCYTPKLFNPLLHFENFNSLNALLVVFTIFTIAICIDKIRIEIITLLIKKKI